MDLQEWIALRDDQGEPLRRAERATLQTALDEAERLLDEGWTDDDPHTGIMYKPGSGETIRVSVQVWMMYRAILTGLGVAIERRRLSRSLERPQDSPPPPTPAL